MKLHKRAHLSFLLLLVVCVVLFVSGATATSIPVANYSFEINNGFPYQCDPPVAGCAYNFGPIPGWETSGYWVGLQMGMQFVGGNPPAYDGNVIAGIGDPNSGGRIWQDVGAATAGYTYTLQVEMLHRKDNIPFSGVVQLEVGGTVVATATGPDGGPGTWNDFTAVYTASAADAGKTLTILLSAPYWQGDFDYVRLDGTSSVPEPATLSLLGSALATAVVAIRRRIGKGK